MQDMEETVHSAARNLNDICRLIDNNSYNIDKNTPTYALSMTGSTFSSIALVISIRIGAYFNS